MLESSNGWLRDKAQQLLLWRGDTSVIPLLEQIASANPRPLARLHALSTLAGFGPVGRGVLERTLRDDAAAVRRLAVRLTEGRADAEPALLETLVTLANDPDPKVRLQLACTLGEWDGAAAGNALAALALHDSGDGYALAAVLSSASRHAAQLVQAMLAADDAIADRLNDPLLKLTLGLGQRDFAGSAHASHNYSEPRQVPCGAVRGLRGVS